ncbi:glycosyltransferase family 2 protein [Bifidobacterium aquikefiricola]|uniref:Glycosyltransferase n=1 Tax=Bifidobacterium aquikefiricola TaxID=3059038 RepID=A0AB39U595_9BIFI
MGNDQQESVVVSVIIPVFNVLQFLPRLVADCEKQQVSGTEFIFIDDGSTDGSSNFLDGLQTRSNYIIIHQNNAGVAVARNVGLKAAHGDYVCFIDPDDSISDDYIATLVNAAKTNATDVVLSDWATIQGSSISYHHISKTSVPAEISQDEVFRTALESERILCSLWAKLFSKHLFNDNSFPIQRTCSDFVPCFTALSKAESICYAPGAYYYYTSDRNSSLQNTQTTNDIQDSVMVHQQLARFIHDQIPTLNESAILDLAYARVQACVHICKSTKVSNKHREFRRYAKHLYQHLIPVMRTQGSLSGKCLYVITTLGYFTTQASLTIRMLLHRI